MQDYKVQKVRDLFIIDISCNLFIYNRFNMNYNLFNTYIKENWLSPHIITYITYLQIFFSVWIFAYFTNIHLELSSERHESISPSLSSTNMIKYLVSNMPQLLKENRMDEQALGEPLSHNYISIKKISVSLFPLTGARCIMNYSGIGA